MTYTLTIKYSVNVSSFDGGNSNDLLLIMSSTKSFLACYVEKNFGGSLFEINVLIMLLQQEYSPILEEQPGLPLISLYNDKQI